eukprot:106281-Rhodomonas_salina.1
MRRVARSDTAITVSYGDHAPFMAKLAGEAVIFGGDGAPLCLRLRDLACRRCAILVHVVVCAGVLSSVCDVVDVGLGSESGGGDEACPEGERRPAADDRAL